MYTFATILFNKIVSCVERMLVSQEEYQEEKIIPF